MAAADMDPDLTDSAGGGSFPIDSGNAPLLTCVHISLSPTEKKTQGQVQHVILFENAHLEKGSCGRCEIKEPMKSIDCHYS